MNNNKPFKCTYCGKKFHSLRSKSAHIVYCRKAKKKNSRQHAQHSFTKTSMIESLKSGNHPTSFPRGHAFNVSLFQKEGIDDLLRKMRSSSESQHDDHDDNFFSDDCAEILPNYDGNYSSYDDDDDDDDNPSDDSDEEDVSFLTDELYEPSLTSSSYDEVRLKYHRLKHTNPTHHQEGNPSYSTADVVDDVNNYLPTSTLCFMHLLQILKRHRVDKKLFDIITEWAFHWCENDSQLFHSHSKKWTRKRLIEHLSKRFNKSDLKPINKLVQLSDGRQVTVPVVDLRACILDILDDTMINGTNNLATGLNHKTWRPNFTQDDSDDQFIIGDKVSGYLYQDGIDLHCPSREDGVDEEKVRPLPLIFHIDKSHSDISGNLAVTPVTVTLAMFNVDIQQETRAWRNCACIPNLSAKKGQSTRIASTDKEINSAQDNHLVIAAAFSSFRQYYVKGGFTWTDKDDNLVILKPYIHLIIGDTLGNNELCGHYNTCHSNCPLKDCKCITSELTSTPTRCGYIFHEDMQGKDDQDILDMISSRNLVSIRDYLDLKENKLLEKTLSIHSIDNAFFHLPLADA